ncbi:nitroreductase family protein [uncultured Dialister sp.]|uniref:nitroreductase family protein n=1 Tax=uncultured Dialister sp. TaxID=278064 RepID=UPI00258A65A8|nr:nitroreductase family protein [uncultured Dialister sp.]
MNFLLFLFIGQKRPEDDFAFSSESVFADDWFKHDSSPFCNAKFLLLYDRMSYKNIYYKKKSGRTGAAAENMALIAAEMGIGSLWNGNIFFAYDELKNWLDAGEMMLAMSFGYPAHHPSPLNRKKEEDVIEIRR